MIDPYYLSMFWQIPDGLEILAGRFPHDVSYAIASGPLVVQEWGYEVALAWAQGHGAFGGFVLLCGAAAAATPLLVYFLVRTSGIGDVYAGVAAFLTIGMRFAGAATRPETFAIDGFALELAILARGKSPLWIVPVVLIWANLHASAILAPIVALLYAVILVLANRVARRKNERIVVIHALKTFALAAVTTLATPNGFTLWTYALDLTIGGNVARQHLAVWRPLSFDVVGAVLTVLPGLLVLMVCGIALSRRQAAEIAIAALCFTITLMHARYEMFLAVAWSPLIARTLEEHMRSAKARPIDEARIPLPLFALALAPVAGFAISHGATAARLPVEEAGPWQSAASIVADHHLAGNTYAPYMWAAYLHWRGLPVRLLIDAHGDPYPADVWRDDVALETLQPGWRSVLARRHLETIVIPTETALAQAMPSEPHWHLVETRDGIVVFQHD